MATVVTYNGVTMRNVETLGWDEEVVYDESGATRLYAKVRATFRGIIHAQGGIAGTPAYTLAGAGATPAAILAEARRRLSEPRATLTVAFGASEILTVKPYDADSFRRTILDVDNGPKPLAVKIDEISADKCFRFTWSVEACVLYCDNSDSRTKGFVLSNRWSVAESMDDNHIITRTIMGSMKLAGNLLKDSRGVYGHQYKPLATPGLERGFRRISLDFEVDKSGNTCAYTVVDRQFRYAPPWPATRMSAKHTVHTANGQMLLDGVRVSLEAPPHAHVGDLIQRAMQIAQYRLNYLTGSARPGQFESKQAIMEFSLAESIGDVTGIDLSMVVMQNKEGEDIFTQLGAVTTTRFGQLDLGPIRRYTEEGGPGTAAKGSEYKIDQAQAPAYYGYDAWRKERRPSVLAVLHCYLGDPCDGLDKGIAQGGSGSTTRRRPPGGSGSPGESGNPGEPSGGNEGTAVSGRQADNVSQVDVDPYQSKEAAAAVYTSSSVSTEYATDHGVLALPLAVEPRRGNATTGFFQASAPQSHRIIRAEAERVGGPPKIPAPLKTYKDGTLEARLLHSQVVALPPRHTPEQTKTVERVSAVYVYAFSREAADSEALRIGRNALMPNDNGFAPASRKLSDYQSSDLDPKPT